MWNHHIEYEFSDNNIYDSINNNLYFKCQLFNKIYNDNFILGEIFIPFNNYLSHPFHLIKENNTESCGIL